MNRTIAYRLLTYSMATVWLVNGLYCKVLGGVPRHEQIVARIVSTDYAHWLAKLIGVLEIAMSAWVISRRYTRFCAVAQIALVLTMNLLEFLLVPDLLLFGRFNSLNALLFAGIVYYTDFVLAPTRTRPA